jgi:hypothetical protein
MSEQLKEDFKTLKIDEDQTLTVKYVTEKYKNLAKIFHPDREGGNTGEFQLLLNAYRRVVQHIEDSQEESGKSKRILRRNSL